MFSPPETLVVVALPALEAVEGAIDALDVAFEETRVDPPGCTA